MLVYTLYFWVFIFVLLYLVFKKEKVSSVGKVREENKVSNRVIAIITARKKMILYGCFFLIAILIFLFELNIGLGNDEIMYYATTKSLLEQGKDLQGYTHAIYSETWGYSTMSIGYLMVTVPFVKIFGLNLVTFRLPMFLSWIGATVFGIEHLRKYYSEEISFYALLFCTFNPILYFQASMAVDSAFMTPILLFGIVFLDKGWHTNKSYMYYIAMLFFGFSYYTYALTLFFTSVLLIIYAIVLLRKKKCSIKTILISMLICLGVGYFAIAGWLYTLFGVKLFNIFEYPSAYITRTKDVGIAFGTKLLSFLMFFVISLNPYAMPDSFASFVNISNIIIPYVLIIQCYVMFLFMFIYVRKKNKLEAINKGLFITLFSTFFLMNLFILRGTHIRYGIFLIILACIFALFMTNLSDKRRKFFSMFYILGFVLNMFTQVYMVNAKIDNLGLVDMYLSKGIKNAIEYIEEKDVKDVSIIFTDELLNAFYIANECDYTYVLATNIYLYDERETITELHNNADLLNKFENYSFYLAPINKEDVRQAWVNNETEETKIGYNLVMNSLLSPDINYDIIYENNVYTLIYTDKPLKLNIESLRERKDESIWSKIQGI